MTETTLPLDGPDIGFESAAASQTTWSAKTWVAMLSLTATSFALVSAEFLPAGLLTPMAADLGISEGMAGQTVTATALVGAIAALLSNVFIGRIDRKKVLMSLSVLAIASNLLATFADNYWLLLLGRAGLGIAISAFWALSVSVVARLVGTGSLGRGVALVSLGTSLATIAAPSLGALIGDWVGWRSAMGITAGLAVIAMVLQFISLPRLPAPDSNSLGDIGRLLKRRGVQLSMLAVLLLIGGHMTGSVYVRPFLEQVTAISTNMIALVLGGFGIGAVVGTMAGGRLADGNASLALAFNAALMALSALALVLWGSNVVVAFVFVAFWGFAFGMAPVVLPAHMARSASDALETAGSLTVTSFQVAITLGAVVGGVIVDNASALINLVVTAVLATLVIVLALSQRKA